jgi:hypothetical protein
MKIKKLIKALEKIEKKHGNINVEVLKNILDDKYKQYDYISSIYTMKEPITKRNKNSKDKIYVWLE